MLCANGFKGNSNLICILERNPHLHALLTLLLFLFSVHLFSTKPSFQPQMPSKVETNFIAPTMTNVLPRRASNNERPEWDKHQH